MRFLITCWPFEGHIFPQMAVASALRQRGHEVAFYTAASARSVVEADGMHVHPFVQLDASRYLRVQQREARTGSRRQSIRVGFQAFRDWLVETIPGQVADIRAVLADWTPDALVTDLSMWGPTLVLWEATPIPVAASSTFLGPMIPGPDAPPWGFGLRPPAGPGGRSLARVLSGVTDLAAYGLRRRVDEIRADNALPPLGTSVNAFCGRLPLYLVPSLRELDYERRDLPASVNYVGPCVWDPPASRAENHWLPTVPSDLPWVHVTEGTSHRHDPFLLRSAAMGLADAPVRVIATTGKARDPAQLGLGRLPSNVHLTQWLDYRALLPRCAVVVTTGGTGTVLAALQAGVPLVVVPTSWDQPDNARRVVESGVGVRLRPGRCSPSRLRAAVQTVLTDQRYRRRARAVADRLAAAPGPGRSAALLEDLVTAASRPASGTTNPTSPPEQGPR